MLIVISPAKTLDYETPAKTKTFTLPDYLDDSAELIHRMREFSALDIAELMHVSSKIAELNFDRFEAWNKNFTEKMPSRQCWRLKVMCIPGWMRKVSVRRISNSRKAICVSSQACMDYCGHWI